MSVDVEAGVRDDSKVLVLGAMEVEGVAVTVGEAH
jgi:hypothetical protein